MLYKNESGDMQKACQYMKASYELNPNNSAVCTEFAAIAVKSGNDDAFIKLPRDLQKLGRLKLYLAVAYMNKGLLKDAANIINEKFEMADIKEGELSTSAIWEELYRKIGGDKAARQHPLPKNLDFRMH